MHDTTSEDHWEGVYRARTTLWSGRPNALLVGEVGEVGDLAPGTALDLGCGEGGDAIWLATRGWTVTGVDVSGTALARAAEHAAAAGVAQRTTWERHDLPSSFPAGRFDLVCASYLHSTVALDRARTLRAGAAAVAPGGTMVVVSHEGIPPWHDHEPTVALPQLQDVLDDLGVAAGGWAVVRAASVAREITDPEGRPATRPDNVVTVRRLAG